MFDVYWCAPRKGVNTSSAKGLKYLYHTMCYILNSKNLAKPQGKHCLASSHAARWSNNSLLQVFFQVGFRHFHSKFIGFRRFWHFSAVPKINVSNYRATNKPSSLFQPFPPKNTLIFSDPYFDGDFGEEWTQISGRNEHRFRGGKS